MTERLPKRAALVPVFNTHQLTPELVGQLNSGAERQVIFDALRHTIGDNLGEARKAKPGPIQHTLVMGPRGFGKSFTVRLIQLDVDARATAGDPVRLVRFPEEQRNIFSPSDFLKEIGRLAGVRMLEAGISQWDGDADTDWATAEAQLDEALEGMFEGGQGLLILTLENFDMLLDSVFKQDGDQQRLRKWMTRPGNRVMVFATSTGAVDLDYDRPIFQAFDRYELEPWSEADCLDYFDRLRESEGQEPLDDTQRAKAHAIAAFIGGNPRLARLLGEVINTNEALTVAETLQALVDELADYYRRRIDDLSPRAAKLLDALIRGGEPCSQSDLAKRVGTTQSRIAQSFSELRWQQVVTGRGSSKGRQTLYQVTDRVFVHFYRTRYLTDEAPRSLLGTITEFLAAFYSDDELRSQWSTAKFEGRLFDASVLVVAGVLRDAPDAGRNLAETDRVVEGLIDGLAPVLSYLRGGPTATNAASALIKTVHIIKGATDQIPNELAKELIVLGFEPFLEACLLAANTWDGEQLNIVADEIDQWFSSIDPDHGMEKPWSSDYYRVLARYLNGERDKALLDQAPPELREAIIRVYGTGADVTAEA